MKSSAKYLAGPALGALLTVTLLAGCSGSSSTDDVPTAPAATATPTATPTPEPVDVTAGETVTPEQAEDLPEGQAAYPLADGTHVVVEATAPLPEPVRAQMTSEMTGIVGADPHGQPIALATGYAKSASQATGKNVVVIYLNPLMSVGDEEAHPTWTAQGPKGSIVLASDGLAEQVANVEAYIAAQPDPSLWDYIVQTA